MGVLAGSCGSCRICTRPIWLKFFTLFFFWDFCVWLGTLALRRCPNCKHRFSVHRQHLGVMRVEHKAQYATPRNG